MSCPLYMWTLEGNEKVSLTENAVKILRKQDLQTSSVSFLKIFYTREV